MIEPYLHVNCLVTGTESGWLNFFGLRLDAAADPTLRALAEAAWRAWNVSEPRLLEPGQWHLPYADNDDQTIEEAWSRQETMNSSSIQLVTAEPLTTLIQISVARCARLSHASFETGKQSTIDEDRRLHDRLLGSLPIHASPAEHQAMADARSVNGIDECTASPHGVRWHHPELVGNLGPGWIQYRKLISGEAVAPLPEAYL